MRHKTLGNLRFGRAAGTFMLVVVALVGPSPEAVRHAPPVADASTETPAVHPAVRDAIARGGRADVLIAVRDGAADDAPLPELARAVAAAQAEVLGALGPDDFSLRARNTYLPILSGYLTESGLAIASLHPRVAGIEPNQILRPLLRESIPTIKADIVHQRYEITGKGVGVAVLDTGIDTDHPDLADAIVDQQCFSSGSRSCAPRNLPRSDNAEDEQGHGTAVSGIVASRGRVSGVGVAPEASIIAVRVFRDRGGAPTEDIVDGLDWVLVRQNQHNIRVVNMSLGAAGSLGVNCDNQYAAVKSAFQRLTARGIAIFVATGNDGFPDRVSFPACISNSIAVGATFDTAYTTAPYCPAMGSVTARNIACFTNRGRAMDLLAPGVLITHPKMGGGTDSGAGTSYAAPMAAGVAALLFQAKPDLRPADVERVLSDTGTPVRHPESDGEFPLIDAQKALEAILPGIPTVPATQTVPSPTSTARATPSPTASSTDAPPSATATGAPTRDTPVPTTSTPEPTSTPSPAATTPRPPPTTFATATPTGDPGLALYLPYLLRRWER